MVLYSGFARYDEVMPAATLQGLAALCRSNWKMASQTFTDMSLREMAPDVAIRLAEILRETIDAEVLTTTLETTVDVTDSLPLVHAPTLVLHRVNDSALSFANSQKIAASIPNARLALSAAVRQIVAGKRFLISDRGEQALRVFEDPVHVYDVSWREAA